MLRGIAWGAVETLMATGGKVNRKVVNDFAMSVGMQLASTVPIVGTLIGIGTTIGSLTTHGPSFHETPEQLDRALRLGITPGALHELRVDGLMRGLTPRQILGYMLEAPGVAKLPSGPMAVDEFEVFRLWASGGGARVYAKQLWVRKRVPGRRVRESQKYRGFRAQLVEDFRPHVAATFGYLNTVNALSSGKKGMRIEFEKEVVGAGVEDTYYYAESAHRGSVVELPKRRGRELLLFPDSLQGAEAAVEDWREGKLRPYNKKRVEAIAQEERLANHDEYIRAEYRRIYGGDGMAHAGVENVSLEVSADAAVAVDSVGEIVKKKSVGMFMSALAVLALRKAK